MKLKALELKTYNQFKELYIDLTYPKGHEKEGKPLDKVCIIGQSGTGKTSLLRLIKFLISRDRQIGTNVFLPDFKKEVVKGHLCFEDMEFIRKFEMDEKGALGTFILNQKKSGIPINREEFIKLRDSYEGKIKPLLINYPTELLVEKKPNILKNPTQDNEIYKKTKEAYLDKLSPEKVIDFAIQDASLSWDYVLKEIKSHKAQEIILKNVIADVALNTKSNAIDLNKANQKYQEWIKKNPNPLENLASKLLNDVLKTLGLKVKLDFDYESVLNLGTIELQTLNGIDVQRTFWSTGTKHLIDTLIPLYELEPQNAVILMDEPERSLYPDLQANIIDIYTSLTNDCQFFFATHSPIIASSFDPWEIIELKFDSENKYVIQNNLYEGIRHVDNYNFYPKYLRWDAILMRVFEMTEEGNEKYREKELSNGISLKKQLEKLRKDGREKTIGYKTKHEEYLRIAKKLGWDL